MRRLALTFLLAVSAWLAPAAPASAAVTTVELAPAADAGLPFWCDWSYDWESRCSSDDGPRLPIGGVDDKVWRAALRFSLASIPAGATLDFAELRLRFDAVCVAPRLGSTACRPPGAVIDAHRLLSSWFAEREPELDERVLSTAVVLESSEPQWLAWDVTALARSWHSGLVSNHGLLLKLQDGDEDFGVGGPYVPSASHPDVSQRPRLVVTFSL